MTRTRYAAIGMFLALVGASVHFAAAEEPEPKPDQPAPAPAPAAAAAEAPKQKEPFFGDHFAMYLETRGGSASFDDIDNPVTTTATSYAQSTLELDSGKTGQFTIGWTLPRGRGQYLLTYTGVADESYDLESQAFQNSYIDESGIPRTPPGPLPWWQLSIHDGHLQSSRTPPVWNPATDDANGNALPDEGEMRYPTVTDSLSRSVPDDLGNQIQTFDLYYRRDFGGLKIHSRWTAGLRYLDYSGAIPMPAWMSASTGSPGFGFSDGVQNGVMIVQQSTTGWGPLGSGEIQFNFFRQRLTLYGLVQAALLFEKLEADSGAFTYLARDPANPIAFVGAGHIESSVSKSGWNTGFEVGARFRILEGFHIIADWNQTGYLDVMLIPTDLSLPTNSSQFALGTTARFVSREIVVSSINIGLSFQF